jgi:hypothetical protein
MHKVDDIEQFDIFFMSYDEKDADDAYSNLLKTFSKLKRIHGVKGEMNAWKAAAEASQTPYFLTIDADTTVLPEFSKKIIDLEENDKRVHVWRSRNNVNGLVYGHGSMHLFNKEHILSFKEFNGVDFTLGAATSGFHIQEECATTTRFNKNAYQSWRSGFKEATKIASKTHLFPNSQDIAEVSSARLRIWCSVGRDADFGHFCLLGARMGTIYGLERIDSPDSTYELKNYEYFDQLWENLNVKEEVENLLTSTAFKLNQDFNFPVVEFDENQSKFIKSNMYKYAGDFCFRMQKYNQWPVELNYFK